MSYPSCVTTRQTFLVTALMILLVLNVSGCARRDAASIDLRHWHRADTLWTGSAGQTATLYDEPTAMSKDAQAVVCEAMPVRTLIILPPNTFPLVAKNTLNIFRLEDSSTPGWYRISRAHGLTWWERNVYTAKSLGGWEWVHDQSSLPVPSQTQSLNGLLVLEQGRFRRIADENKVTSLFDAPAEGLIYVGEPGVGVVGSIDLSSACE
jgi:hypothetical protein